MNVLLSWAKKIKGDKKLGEYDVIEDLIKDNGLQTRNTLAEAFLQSDIPKILETNILEVYNFINKDEFLELLKLKEQRMQMQKEETMKNDEIEIFNALLNDDVTLIKPSQAGIKAYYGYQAYAQNLVKEAKLEFSIKQREFLKEIYEHLSFKKCQCLKSYESYVESKKYKAEKYGFDSDSYYQMKEFILSKQEFFDYVLDSTDISKEILEDLKEINLEDNLSNLINKVDNAQAIQEARIASYISNDDTSNVLENKQSSSNINRLYRK